MLPVELIQPLPKPGDAGFFGAVRKYDIHTGIDMYTAPNAPVVAIRDGTVISIEKFTGEHAGHPWWNNTWAILVEHEYDEWDRGVIVYGEVEPLPHIQPGYKVTTGEHIANVLRVLKKDKGKNPPDMLHVEFHAKGTPQTYLWHLDLDQPDTLLNPTWLINTLVQYKYVVVFPDWCATGLWDIQGHSIPVENLPVKQSTIDLMNKMMKDYNSCYFDDEYEYVCPEGVNHAWDERSREIIALIKEELPDWEVKYNHDD